MVDDAAYGLTPEALAYARERYEKTDQPVRTIGDDVGVSRGKLYKIAKAEGWPLRKDRPPRGLSEALKLDLEATKAEENVSEASQGNASQGDHRAADVDTSPDSVAARLEAEVEKQLREVEGLRGDSASRGKRSAAAERVARTLATLTEILFKVRRLRQPGNISGSNDDDLPADPDAFRLALAERIESFVRSWTDAAVSEPDQACDGEPAAS